MFSKLYLNNFYGLKKKYLDPLGKSYERKTILYFCNEMIYLRRFNLSRGLPLCIKIVIKGLEPQIGLSHSEVSNSFGKTESVSLILF